jgi:pyridoxine 5-phosphate synthase
MTAKLNVNIDHVATLREARKTIEPSVIAAAVACEQAGADGITVHLRGDRRHIQDSDVELLRAAVTTYLNLEMAATDEMIAFAARVLPDAVSLVPETAGEITTEGGLDAVANFEKLRPTVEQLRSAGIFVSMFIDPEIEQIDAAKRAGAEQVELCTAEYSDLTRSARAIHGDGLRKAAVELERLKKAAVHAHGLGMDVAAGHGLTCRNVGPLAKMPEITEFNIGHNIIARSVFIGLDRSVREMIAAISLR